MEKSIQDTTKTQKKPKSKAKKLKTPKEKIPTIQWTIRGVTMESRLAAHKAAEKADEFVGNWVSRKILEAAQAELTSKKEIARPVDNIDLLAKINEMFVKEVEKINEKVDNILLPKRGLLARLFDI